MTDKERVEAFLDEFESDLMAVFNADEGYDSGQHVSCLTPRQRMVLDNVKARVMPLARHSAELAKCCQRMHYTEAQTRQYVEAYRKTVSQLPNGKAEKGEV